MKINNKKHITILAIFTLFALIIGLLVWWSYPNVADKSENTRFSKKDLPLSFTYNQSKWSVEELDSNTLSVKNKSIDFKITSIYSKDTPECSEEELYALENSMTVTGAAACEMQIYYLFKEERVKELIKVGDTTFARIDNKHLDENIDTLSGQVRIGSYYSVDVDNEDINVLDYGVKINSLEYFDIYYQIGDFNVEEDKYGDYHEYLIEADEIIRSLEIK